MGITNSSKQISSHRMDCEGTIKVTLALSAAPDIRSHPADILLVLNRSAAMAGIPFEAIQTAAGRLIDLVTEATGGTVDGLLEGGSRMGIVSFSDEAYVSQPFTVSAKELKAAVNGLFTQGLANHAAAFETGAGLFDPDSENEKVMVLFSDGVNTAGGPPSPAAAAAKKAGISLYCIGLPGAEGLDRENLLQWASAPVYSHTAFPEDGAQLLRFTDIFGSNLNRNGAANIRIREQMEAAFTITGVLPPSAGSASMTDSRTILWEISDLGTDKDQGASLEFYVRHTGQTSGTKPVNQSLSFEDVLENAVFFTDPAVTVECEVPADPAPCPPPIELEMEPCQDFVRADLGSIRMDGQGRILQLAVTIRNVCPGRRTALGVILTETDGEGREYQRGIRTLTIPAHQCQGCRDVRVPCILFVLPEDQNPSCGFGLCARRKLKVRLIAHSMDSTDIP